jgi:hypothetical protein
VAKEHLLFDKTEIVAMVMVKNERAQKRAQMVNLKYDKIVSISIKPHEEKTLFGKKPSELIEIVVSGRSEPIVYTKLKEIKFWEGYKQGLEIFARENRISFTDETATEAAAT